MRTVHLALIREDDLAAAAGWIDGQSLLKALLNVGAPHALCIVLQGFVKSIPQLLAPTPGGGSRHPLRRRGGTMEREPLSEGWEVKCLTGVAGGGGEKSAAAGLKSTGVATQGLWIQTNCNKKEKNEIQAGFKWSLVILKSQHFRVY